MRALIEYLARALAEHPDDVVVEEEHDGDRVLLYLYVNDEDKGRVIGRDGRCANAMRSLLHVAAVRAGVRATLNIE
ncbi:MAG: KH domain-containing protein [Dehalococcoidia bacterium]|nr:KH domain-containing protein [Dehalococcoidia bacterium]TAJ17615.1 MAG: KH domain-containing protein [Dehalococcoidia bacterium]TAK79719.1 MAG: KH domain-containing protein [Dehalococcoidia bacterium]